MFYYFANKPQLFLPCMDLEINSKNYAGKPNAISSACPIWMNSKYFLCIVYKYN